MRASHAGDAEAGGAERTDLRLAADRETKGEDLAAVARIDEPVVPKPCRGEKRRRFAVELVDDLLLHRLELRPVDRAAEPRRALLRDDREHFRRLLAAHDGDAVVGPGEDEARIIGAAAHA